MRKILILAALLLSSTAQAQSVQQSGSVTPGHAVRWISNGIVGDAGTAANGFITSLGVVNNGGPGICTQSAAATSAGYNQLCLSASTSGPAQITLQNYGTATAQNLQFVINGTVVAIPTGGSGTIPTIALPTVANAPICATNTTGALADCTTGTNGQIYVGATSSVPAWVSASGDVTSISSAGAFVIGKVNGVTYPASPSVGTAPYVSGSNTVTYGAVPATGGGTGVSSPTAHGVLIAQGASAMTTASSASIGLCLLSQGAGSDPAFAPCASGAGTAGGSNTQIQYNNATSLAGSANLTWVSPALTIGVNATATGQLVLANGGSLGNSVTIQNNANTVAYNFNLPATAGTSGQPLLSSGGGSSAMTFGTLGIGGGGTNCASPSGTCVDNISGWSSTGFINRTGAGTYSFTTAIGLINGGTGANLTASNGGIVYSGASALAILSGTATANQIILSGSSAAPSWSTATYPATTTANQLLYSSSTNTIAGLATGNNGVLITSAGGAPSISSTLPSAVQGNITATGTIASGVWNGTPVALAYGGTNANLTASNGGIFYSTASAGAILAGTATANLPLLSGTSTTPSWATITYPTSATSGGVPYFSTSTSMASSAALGSGQIVVGGGAGSAPTTSANASLSSGALTLGQTGSVAGSIVLSGSTSGTGTVRVAAAAGTSTIFQLPATNGSNGYVLQTDGTGVTSWVTATSGGNVNGPVSSTDTAIARFNGTGGTVIQNSGVTIDGSNNISGAVSLQRSAGVAIQGTNTNDSASAGYVGEYVESNIVVGSAVSLSTTVASNVTSISLTAGDWDVSGNVCYNSGASTVVTYAFGAISTTSANIGTAPNNGGVASFNSTSTTRTSYFDCLAISPKRISLTSTTTTYLVAQSSFTTSTLAAYGAIRARRMR